MTDLLDFEEARRLVWKPIRQRAGRLRNAPSVQFANNFGFLQSQNNGVC